MSAARLWLMIGAIAAQAVRPVHAGPDPSDADRLFEEGRTLAKQNRFAEACERFTKSDAIQRTFGTAVNLGDCAKRDGHAGLAWQLYDDASRFADRDGATDLAKFARQRASSVASALCTIIVTIEDPAAGMTVRIGGHQVTPAAEIHELVEPGEVDVVVAIPSATRLVRSARCSAAGELATVTFPADRLRVVERSPSPAPPSPPAGRATVPHGLIAEANVGIAAADVVGGAGWLPYVAFDATVSGWASSRLAIGGRVTGLIGASSVQVMLRSPNRVVSGGPVVCGFVGPAVQVVPTAHLSLGAAAGLGALLASPTGRTYAPAFQLGASYSPSAVWHISLEGIGMKQTTRVGAVVIALIGAWLR
jgi:hypothetical protein